MRLPRWLNFPKSWSLLQFVADGFAGTLRSLLRMLYVILFITCGYFLGDFVGKVLGRSLGIIGHLLGLPVGFVALLSLLWAFVLGRILLFFPFPDCRRGNCHGIEDYNWYLGAIYGRVAWGLYRYRCKCEDEYIREGKKFTRAPLPPTAQTRLPSSIFYLPSPTLF